MSEPGRYDVAVVGAGMAGMSAARTLAEAGARVIVLEARDRIGGRCFCNNSFPAPFDYGAQLFHQVTPAPEGNGTRNSLYDLAARLGIQLFPNRDATAFFTGTEQLADAAALPFSLQFVAMSELIDRAGAAAEAGKGEDVSAAAATASLAKQEWYRLAAGVLSISFGAGLDEMSCLDLYRFHQLDNAPEGQPNEYVIPSGMGNFVATFAGGLPIARGVAVEAIEWDHPDGVRLSTGKGPVAAGAVVVTASMGVLAADRIRFAPALPDPYRDAIANLPMGVVDKIGLRLSKDVFGKVEASSFATQLVDSERVTLALSRFAGKNQVHVFIYGDQARELEAQGSEAMIAYATDYVAGLYGEEAQRAVVEGTVNPWHSDPWALGSYPIARPGHAGAHQQMATPLGGRVFFAGDGVSSASFGTLVGAYQTGLAAARAALAAVRGAAPSLLA